VGIEEFTWFEIMFVGNIFKKGGEIMEIDENVHRLANLFRAGGNAIRLQILIRLSDSDSYVSELAKLLDRSTSSTSAHLKDLKAVDLVEAVKRH
jgi:DNA-binding transcriptional ArsR family regulator